MTKDQKDTLLRIVRWWIGMLIMSSLVVWSHRANADKPQPPPEMEQSQRQYQTQKSTATAIAGAHALSGSVSNARTGDASATGGQANAEGGEASAIAGDASANNALTLNEAAPENDITFRTAPGLAVGGIYPANPCHMPWNAGLSIIGGAGTLGNTRVDPVCQQLEWTRVAFQMGLRDAALHSLCSMDQAEGNPHCITENEYQDREVEMGLLRDNTKIMQGQYDEALDELQSKDRRIAALEETLRKQNETIVCQVEKACGK